MAKDVVAGRACVPQPATRLRSVAYGVKGAAQFKENYRTSRCEIQERFDWSSPPGKGRSGFRCLDLRRLGVKGGSDPA
jgi:hypothetical protein